MGWMAAIFGNSVKGPRSSCRQRGIEWRSSGDAHPLGLVRRLLRKRHFERLASKAAHLATFGKNCTPPRYKSREYAHRNCCSHSGASISCSFLARHAGQCDRSTIGQIKRPHRDLHFCRLAKRTLAGPVGDVTRARGSLWQNNEIADHHVLRECHSKRVTFLHSLRIYFLRQTQQQLCIRRQGCEVAGRRRNRSRRYRRTLGWRRHCHDWNLRRNRSRLRLLCKSRGGQNGG